MDRCIIVFRTALLAYCVSVQYCITTRVLLADFLGFLKLQQAISTLLRLQRNYRQHNNYTSHTSVPALTQGTFPES